MAKNRRKWIGSFQNRETGFVEFTVDGEVVALAYGEVKDGVPVLNIVGDKDTRLVLKSQLTKSSLMSEEVRK